MTDEFYEEPLDEADGMDGGDDAAEADSGLYKGDCGSLTLEMRQLLCTLLRGPYLSRTRQPSRWKLLIGHKAQIKEQLANLFLDLVIDTNDGYAYVIKPEDTGGVETVNLLRTASLSLNDTVLLIDMRLRLMQNSGSGERTMITLDEITGIIRGLNPAKKGDEMALKRTVNACVVKFLNLSLIEKLEGGGNNYLVLPIIKVIFNGVEINQLKASCEECVQRRIKAGALVGEGTEDSDE